MKANRSEELIIDFLNSKEGSVREALEKKLNNLGYSMRDLEQLKELYENLDDLEELKIPEPAERLTENFYEFLESHIVHSEQQRNRSRHMKKWIPGMIFDNWKLKFVYAFILILIGWALGFWLMPNQNYKKQMVIMSDEIHEMKVMMTLTLLNQPSSFEKLRGIQNANNLERLNDRVVKALLNTLNYDPDDDVRLEAIESLKKYTHNPDVRQGLVQSIEQQDSPVVLLYLADVMVKLQERNAIAQFKKLLEEKSWNQDVREKIEKIMITLI